MTDPNTVSGAVSPERPAAMTGLQTLEAMLTGEIAAPPIRTPMNFWLHRVEPGVAEFRGVPQAQHANPMGAVHGGWYGTLLDSAMGCAVLSRLSERTGYTTLEYKVNITRSVPMGVEVSVIGDCQHAGRSTGVARAEMRGVADGRLYATASTTCIILPG